MQKTLIDEFVHHIAEAQRILRSAADELHNKHERRTFTREEAQEWNLFATISSALVEQRDHIVMLTPPKDEQ